MALCFCLLRLLPGRRAWPYCLEGAAPRTTCLGPGGCGHKARRQEAGVCWIDPLAEAAHGPQGKPQARHGEATPRSDPTSRVSTIASSGCVLGEGETVCHIETAVPLKPR